MPEESRAKCPIWLCDKDYFVMPAAQNSRVKNLDLRIFHTSLHSYFYLLVSSEYEIVLTLSLFMTNVRVILSLEYA